MKTIGVKLSDAQAEAFQVAAARRGLTTSAALTAILRLATMDFVDFEVLDGVTPPKRGRASRPRADEELAGCFAAGETVAELFDRFDRPRNKRRG